MLRRLSVPSQKKAKGGGRTGSCSAIHFQNTSPCNGFASRWPGILIPGPVNRGSVTIDYHPRQISTCSPLERDATRSEDVHEDPISPAPSHASPTIP